MLLKQIFVFSLLALGLQGTALADRVAKNGSDYIRIQEQPCPAEVAKFIPPQFVQHFKGGEANIKGTNYQVC